MTWRSNELWLDTDVLWFREALPATAGAAEALDPFLFLPVANGLEASRQRREAAKAARRRLQLATRTVPAVALVVGSATMLPIGWLRHSQGAQGAHPLQEDPPSLTYRLDNLITRATDGIEADVRSALSRVRAYGQAEVTGLAADLADVEWHHATSLGRWYSGRLVGGTQLPVEGPDWVTWDPVTDSVPNLPNRLYGNERTIRTLLAVIAAYRAAHPHAPRVVVGDISRRDGGRMDDHISHQNGLDVDVYYPRHDRRLRAPIAVGQIDHDLAQDLLNRFVAAGAQMIFVGYSTRLHGPSGIVVPYPNHENHMHVRFPRRGS